MSCVHCKIVYTLLLIVLSPVKNPRTNMKITINNTRRQYSLSLSLFLSLSLSLSLINMKEMLIWFDHEILLVFLNFFLLHLSK